MQLGPIKSEPNVFVKGARCQVPVSLTRSTFHESNEHKSQNHHTSSCYGNFQAIPSTSQLTFRAEACWVHHNKECLSNQSVLFGSILRAAMVPPAPLLEERKYTTETIATICRAAEKNVNEHLCKQCISRRVPSLDPMIALDERASSRAKSSKLFTPSRFWLFSL